MAEPIISEELEKKEILNRYRRLLKIAGPVLKDNDSKIIKQAFQMAVDAHKEQRRKSGEPYIYHPIAVAQICVEEIGLGTTSIIAALLHDVVEDTEVRIETIEKNFGTKVARIIEGLTKISGTFSYGSSQQAENFRKMLFTLTEDVRIILIKLADRLHNMRTLHSMKRESQLKIASETLYLYAPLAHRLGLNLIKTELEDLSLKYTDYEYYSFIAEKIQQTKAARNRFIKEFTTPIENELTRQGFKFNIKGRPKSIHSIYNKIKKQNIEFEDIYDLFAIRIILDVPFEKEKSACWEVYSIVTDFYKPNESRLRDFINQPKQNGYESLHTTVKSKSGQWVEVQIRTVRMDEIAEKGFAAHWKYKENVKVPKEVGIEHWLIKVRESLESGISNAEEFVSEFRESMLVSEDIYVYTPKGEVKILPINATPVDFAYEIHTQVGYTCIGAKVNREMVSLDYKLKNGDIVEVITSNKQKPSLDWLKFVVSSKAKNKIREALRDEQRKQALEGKSQLEAKIKQLGLEPSDEVYSDLRDFLGLKSIQQLYLRMYFGGISQSEFKRFNTRLKSPIKKEKTSIQDAKSFEKEVRKIRGVDTDMLLIGEDMDKIDYTIASCCNPIAGDEVFGFVTVSEGIKIHSTSCPNALQLMSNYGYRIIKAKWTQNKNLAFLAGIKVNGTDRLGLINDITKVISSDLKVNMRSFSIETEGTIFEGTIMVFVQDTDQLNLLMNKIKKVNGVYKVTRFQYN